MVMAAFYSYSCLWKNCGKSFTCLEDLIEHVEDVHVEKDAAPMEKLDNLSPPALALSHILRFFTEAARQVRRKQLAQLAAQNTNKSSQVSDKGRHVSSPASGSHHNLTFSSDTTATTTSTSATLTPTQVHISKSSVSNTATSGSSNTTSGNNSHIKTTSSNSIINHDLISDGSDSDESWTTNETFSSDAILSMMATDEGLEKPFACPVPGCNKRYKNVNGMKYHAKNGHKKEIRVRKAYRCTCKKSYRSAMALKKHCTKVHHGNPSGGLPEPVRSLEIDLIANSTVQ
ncbi:Juxtaposed with another zinc finger protein 1 [Trichoplax sp. H2]|nr:Juxtaposed with another zinc finger protein 1 [Trichoplax sp. H2]|eukprot:RDD37887.1 Juxtaposed with another zinc finger protein 1 [Trichoplax sp. H2]